MVWFRDYPPIRSKSVVTVVSYCGGLIWVGATFVILDHFKRKRMNTILGMCSLWMSWLHVTSGVSLWLNCFILRLLNLCLILVMKRCAIKYDNVALPVLLSPVIIYSITQYSLPALWALDMQSRTT
ncbi:unnamed protein product [Calypogeia fissa]